MDRQHRAALPFPGTHRVLYSSQPVFEHRHQAPRRKGQAPALGGEELGVNVSEATVKGAADLKLVGSHVAKHEAGLDVLSPGVANVGGGLANSHLFDEEAAFSADGFDVFFKASSEAESRVESLGVKDALEHCLEVLCGLPLDQQYGIPKARAQALSPRVLFYNRPA